MSWFFPRRLAALNSRLRARGMRGQAGFDGYSGLQAHLGVRRAPALPAPRWRIGHAARQGRPRAIGRHRGFASGGPETRTSAGVRACLVAPRAARGCGSVSDGTREAQAGAALRTAAGQKLGRGCSNAGARSRPGILVSVYAGPRAARNTRRRRHGLGQAASGCAGRTSGSAMRRCGRTGRRGGPRSEACAFGNRRA